MDINSVLSMAERYADQRLAQAKLSAVISTVKKQEDLQQQMVAQLLGSLPNANPEGVGSQCDCYG